MKLNFKAAFDALLSFGTPKTESDPVSIVVLLREPQFLTADQLCAAAGRAFGVPFTALRTGAKDPEMTDPRHCLILAVLFTLLRAGVHTLSFLNMTRPYGEGDFAKNFGESLPLEGQRKAWTEHKAFTAVDYVKGGADVTLEYAVLAQLSTEMFDDNCLALYIPGQDVLVPNDGSIEVILRSIASTRQVAV